MKIVLNFGKDVNEADTAFTLYFTIMACLFTKTYIQLAAQLGIITYVFYSCLNKKGLRLRISQTVAQNEFFLLFWLGALTLLAALSGQWAYSTKADSNTVLTLFRMFVIGINLFLYVNTYNRAVSVLKSLIYSSVVMAVIVLLTTPLSQYGQAGEEGFGTLIGQQRNTFGAVMAFLIPICVVFEKHENLKYGKWIAAFFAFSLICSGSRGAMLQMIIIVALYVLLSPGIKKKIKYISIGTLFCVVMIIIIINVPFLYAVIWVRFANMFSTVLGMEQIADSSSYGRELYKVLALQMFWERPWLGFGVDGFFCRLRDVRYVNGYYLHPVYSHCNFAELAADFGIAGLAIWYIPVLSVLVKSFRVYNFTPVLKMIFIILTSMITLDYARIPWSSHSNIYTYFCVFLLFFFAEEKLILAGSMIENQH